MNRVLLVILVLGSVNLSVTIRSVTIQPSAEATVTPAQDFPQFETVEIDPHAGEICYAVTLADVDGDGLRDIVVVTENRVLWYRNPTWDRGILIEDQTARDNVCIAAHDIDGDGQIEFALGAGWTRIGTLQWIRRSDNSADSWVVHAVGEEPWLHRISWGDVLGTGRAQLVVSPLNRSVGSGVRLMALEVPSPPEQVEWPATIIDHSLNRLHNHEIVDFDGDGRLDVLTASQEGIHLFKRSPEGGWSRTRLGSGAAGDAIESQGAGEVKLGRFADGRRFVAAVEPMHGTTVSVYTEPASGSGLWDRYVLEEMLRQGHALWVADLNRDGGDEIIVGHREAGPGVIKGPGVYVFQALDSKGSRWRKHVLDDGGMAAEDAVAGDLTGNGWIDVVAVGRSTHNVKLYLNHGPR